MLTAGVKLYKQPMPTTSVFGVGELLYRSFMLQCPSNLPIAIGSSDRFGMCLRVFFFCIFLKLLLESIQSQKRCIRIEIISFRTREREPFRAGIPTPWGPAGGTLFVQLTIRFSPFVFVPRCPVWVLWRMRTDSCLCLFCSLNVSTIL